MILLNLAAKKEESENDFRQLELICSVLKYPIGAFVNIASSSSWLPSYKRQSDKKFTLHEIAVHLEDTGPKLLISSQ